MQPTVPYIPENAPFTAEQRAYLNGFFAGLFSVSAPGPRTSPSAAITILFGSQTGNAESLAKRLAKEAAKRGFAATVVDLAQYSSDKLKNESNLLVITSTYGDGDPPDNAKTFWSSLASDTAPKLAALRFSVCALGDSNYPQFCAFGRNVDVRLEALGAQRIGARVDCDVEYEAPFKQWMDAVLGAFSQQPQKTQVVESSTTPSPSSWSRLNPFPAPLVNNRLLNCRGSGKETRHFEFSLEDSGLRYEIGDAMGVTPVNCPELVNEIARALGYSLEVEVPGKDGATVTLREALLRHYSVTSISQPLLKAMAEKSGDERLRKLAAPGVNGELTEFLRGREVIDLLLSYPTVRFTPPEFVSLLKKLQPRLYSIASSPRAHSNQVHLCVSVVRYQSLGRNRKGVCSTFLADRAATGTPVPVFIHTNKHFRLPSSDSAPVIMVGPGTGIAPFRGFLEERRATGAKGKNWLFFGDQHAATDFLYREELEQFQRDGVLTRLDTAFSRDQAEKVYVQHRMLEHAHELFAWLEDGAHFYVCGDASRMAKDVDAALHRVIEIGSKRSAEQAQEYVRQLMIQKRYQRDVY